MWPYLPSSWPEWLRIVVAASVPGIVFLGVMAAGAIVYVYLERKIAGFMQDRVGPTRVGPHGLLQTIADAIKLLFKEAVFPRGVDRHLFTAAPMLVVVGAFLPFATLPFGPNLVAADLNIGLFYVAAVSSLSTVGLILAGWASNNKYALFGALRSAAQIVSYEIPALLALLPVVMAVGSLSLQDVVKAQEGGLGAWLLWRWFPLMPVAAAIVFISGLAECNRTPFDIPEAESELVAGFHTEYSGLFFGLFFMSEYAEMFVVACVTSVLFLGGWWAPVPAWQTLGGIDLAPLWLLVKAWSLVFLMMWLRWTLPRLRVDQLMYVAWKVLLPTAMALAFVVGLLVVLPATRDGFPWDGAAAWITNALLWGSLIVSTLGAKRAAAARRLHERHA